MVKQFENFIGKPESPAYSTVDSGLFDDPLAKRTAWSQMDSHGENVQNYFLDDRNPKVLIFKCSKKKYMAAGVFFLIGLIAVILAVTMLLSEHSQKLQMFGFGMFFGLAFTVVGILMWHMTTVPKVFNLDSGFYYHAKKVPVSPVDIKQQKKTDHTPLNDIASLQIIKYLGRHNNQSYESYQVNLILKNASRINVLSHPKKSAIISDAHTLAEALKVPIWDGSKQQTKNA